MLDDLDPEDRISLISFSDGAEVMVEHVAGNDPALADAISDLWADGATNVYEGLRAGYDMVAAHEEDGRQNRVIFLSDGEATAGIVDDDRIVGMSKAYNELGYSLTTIGMGTNFNPALMRDLSESGSGAFYFLEDPSAVQEVFEEEVQTFLVPLAEDLRIDLDVDSGYRLRALYGTKLGSVLGNSGAIDIPTVQIAHRTAIEDDAGGRRGGGGAIIAELVPVSPEAAQERGTVGHLTLTYNKPGSEEVVAQEAKILSGLEPGEAPAQGHFDGAGVEKAFVMLNIFAGFEMAADRSQFGDYRGALSVLEPLAESVQTWLADNPDPDIEDDLLYLQKFIDNLERQGAEAPPPQQNPPEPWPQD
jgi:Ca-activated chloride channel family protein